MPLVARILIILVVLPILAFCGFGFLATFEPPLPSTNFLAWRIGYALAALLCLTGITWAIVAKSTRA